MCYACCMLANIEKTEIPHINSGLQILYKWHWKTWLIWACIVTWLQNLRAEERWTTLNSACALRFSAVSTTPYYFPILELYICCHLSSSVHCCFSNTWSALLIYFTILGPVNIYIYNSWHNCSGGKTTK